MTSHMKNNNNNKIQHELIDYIWEPHHYDAANIINYYVRRYFINFAKVLKPLVDLVFSKELDLWDDNLNFIVYNKHRDNFKIFNMLRACQCCERHQVNKPKHLDPVVDTKLNMTFNTGCKCICRHTIRWLCRL
jgi:hypothetical protein